MPAEQTPEILRLSLQDIILRVKICKLGAIEQALSEALDPPSEKNIRRAMDALVDVKALTFNEELTPLGRQLVKLPLDVFLGKLIIIGTVFCCVDVCITIAAVLSSKSPFVAPFGSRAQADSARLAFRKGKTERSCLRTVVLSNRQRRLRSPDDLQCLLCMEAGLHCERCFRTTVLSYQLPQFSGFGEHRRAERPTTVDACRVWILDAG